MTMKALATRAGADHLEILGAFHEGDDTIVLLGPREPGFWTAFTASPEWQDGSENPIDRWSRRIIDAISRDMDATPLYPFGEPVQPFFTWALESGRAWASPVMLLVHDTAGMMLSYRGALKFSGQHELTPTSPKPCDTCDTQPCRTACPVNALTPGGYDLPACHAFLDTEAGQDCMTRGCAVRRACPVSQTFDRDPDQSAYHMRQFHKCP